MSHAPAMLNKQFPISGLHFEAGNGGLTRAVINTPAATGEIYLHGAHVTAWQPADQSPVLWMSGCSNFESGKPIRGGVPVCFPWFGPHPSDPTAPAHGHARVLEWEIVAAREMSSGGIELTLEKHIEPFLAKFTIEFGTHLRMNFSTVLTSAATGSQSFESALHTYFSVGDVRSISIAGLEASSYIDKMNHATRKPATGLPVTFSGETDRVYSDPGPCCVLSDSMLKRTIKIRKSGSRSTVVWNPWIDKSVRMPDFGDHEWPGMVCFETGNVGLDAVVLAPGESHSITATIEVDQWLE